MVVAGPAVVAGRHAATPAQAAAALGLTEVAVRREPPAWAAGAPARCGCLLLRRVAVDTEIGARDAAALSTGFATCRALRG